MALRRTILFYLLSLHTVLAQDDPVLELERLNFVFENDHFVHTDRWYTSGLDLSLLFRLKQPPSMLERDNANTYLAFAISHEMYTPREFNNPELQSDDRPYAGWLYGSFALHQSNAYTLDTVELQIGIVGPSAKAEQLQRFIHDHILGDPVDGWQHQLSDEPGINLAYHHHERFVLASKYESLFIPRIGAVIGNVRTELDAGMLYRRGVNLPADFGQNLMVVPGLDSAIPAYNKGAVKYRPAYSYYLQLQADLRLIGRDLFLEGNSYKESHSVEPYPLVGRFGGGVGGSYNQYEASLIYTVESKSFTQQPKFHAFGSLLFTYHYY